MIISILSVDKQYAVPITHLSEILFLCPKKSLEKKSKICWDDKQSLKEKKLIIMSNKNLSIFGDKFENEIGLSSHITLFKVAS